LNAALFCGESHCELLLEEEFFHKPVNRIDSARRSCYFRARFRAIIAEQFI
jgi:hypothetical protein